MIHARVSRDPEGKVAEIHLSVTADSLPNFQQLLHRALNCWDSAPKELKDLGDMVTHGYVTQDHTYKPMNTVQSGGDYYSPAEQEVIRTYIACYGFDAWFRRLREGTTAAVLKQEAKD